VLHSFSFVMQIKSTLDLRHEPLGRTLIIGDVHDSEKYRFLALCMAIQNGVLGDVDRIISMSDYGPDGFLNLVGNGKHRGCMPLFEDLGVPLYHVYGNHDEAWESYIRHDDLGKLREVNQTEDPRMKDNPKILELIEEMKMKIKLDGVLVQHAPFHPFKPWPGRNAESLEYTHQYMQEMGFPTMMVGHIHENFVHDGEENMSSYIMSKEGEQTEAISLGGTAHLVGVGRFNEKGNVAILENDHDGSPQVTFHKLWRDPSAYYS